MNGMIAWLDYSKNSKRNPNIDRLGVSRRDAGHWPPITPTPLVLSTESWGSSQLCKVEILAQKAVDPVALLDRS